MGFYSHLTTVLQSFLAVGKIVETKNEIRLKTAKNYSLVQTDFVMAGLSIQNIKC